MPENPRLQIRTRADADRVQTGSGLAEQLHATVLIDPFQAHIEAP
jgi:hypothetical protein